MDKKKDRLSVSAFFIAWPQKKQKLTREQNDDFIKYKFVFYTLRVQFLSSEVILELTADLDGFFERTKPVPWEK